MVVWSEPEAGILLASGFCWLMCFECYESEAPADRSISPPVMLVPMNVTSLKAMFICVIVTDLVTFLFTLTKHLTKAT